MFGVLPKEPTNLLMRARYTLPRGAIDYVPDGSVEFEHRQRFVSDKLRQQVAQRVVDDCMTYTENEDFSVWELNVIVATEQQFWKLVNHEVEQIIGARAPLRF